MIYDNNYLNSKIKSLNDNFKDFTDEQIKKKINSDDDFSKNILDLLSELRNKIGESMKADKLCFLMANGCSIYAGSKSTINDISANNEDKEYSPIIEDISNVTTNNIEEQMNQLNTIKDYYNLIKNNEKYDLIEKYIEEKKKHFLNNLVLGLNYENLTIHEIFMIKLRAFNVIKKSNFFTPNYDLALEYSLDKIQEVYNDGFVGFVNRKFNISSFNTNNPNVVKIHGSLNWFLDKKTGDLKEIQPKFNEGIIDDKSLGESIIYPSSLKLIQTYNLPYSELLRFMLNTIQTGKNVIFILGYKYGDNHINDVLLKGITNPNNIFYFFDFDNNDSNEFINKIKSLEETLNNINIIRGCFLGDFSIFVNYLMPSCAEKTDQEKIFDLLQRVLNNGKN